MNPVLKVDHLSVTLDKKRILDDISLEVHSGEFLIMLGDNGAGKSTLARTFAGMHPYDGGILLSGKALHAYESKERAREITYIPSTIRSYDESLSVKEFVLLGRYPHHARFDPVGCDEKECASSVLDYFGIRKLADSPINALSSGEMQLVLLAQATIQDSHVWIMDEPTSSLDIQNTRMMYHEIRKLAEIKTLILITHDINLAYHLKGNICYMRQGEIIWHGDSQTFFTTENLRTLYQTELLIDRHGIRPDFA